jgi:hypothetical protein
VRRSEGARELSVRRARGARSESKRRGVRRELGVRVSGGGE